MWHRPLPLDSVVYTPVALLFDLTHGNDDDAEVGRLARHLLRYESEFLRYLEEARIPATNNEGERTIRFAVVLRKRGSCNKTERGAATLEVVPLD